MLLRNLNNSETASSLAVELAEGFPTISAFARLCGHALAGETHGVTPSPEALALVAASGKNGLFEIRGDKDSIASSERFLSVCIELEPDRKLLFRDKNDPRRTMEFLEAFRQLCHSGFVVHHMMKDFSLSKSGFDMADTLNIEEYNELIDFAVEVDH